MIIISCIVTLILFLILSTTIKLEIKNFVIKNSDIKLKLVNKYSIVIKLSLFNKITFLKIKLNKNIIKNSKIFRKLNFKTMDLRLISSSKKISEIIKKVDISKFILDINIGTESVIATSYLTAIISAIISIYLANNIKKVDGDSHKYSIMPVYENTNFLELYLDCMINIKMIYIIKFLNLYNNKIKV